MNCSIQRERKQCRSFLLLVTKLLTVVNLGQLLVLAVPKLRVSGGCPPYAKLLASSLALLLTAGTLPAPALAQGEWSGSGTATPIKHLVVIFQENVSFDHYFGTYPYALNPKGEPAFWPLPHTPSVNGLYSNLLMNNPNATNPKNGSGATNPFRLDRTQAATADQDHD